MLYLRISINIKFIMETTLTILKGRLANTLLHKFSFISSVVFLFGFHFPVNHFYNPWEYANASDGFKYLITIVPLIFIVTTAIYLEYIGRDEAFSKHVKWWTIFYLCLLLIDFVFILSLLFT